MSCYLPVWSRSTTPRQHGGLQGVIRSYTDLIKLAQNVTTRTVKAMDRVITLSMDTLVNLFKKVREIAGNIPEYLKMLEEVIDDLIKSFKKVENMNPRMIQYVEILMNNTEYLKSIEFIKSIGRPLGRFLAIEQEAAVNLYSRSYYIAFNKALRGLNNNKMTEEFRAMEKLLNNSLDDLPNYIANEPLFRSTKMNEELINQLFQEGKEFSDKAFMSTTYSKKALNNWMKVNPNDNVVFKIFGKSGKLIEASSSLPKEAEVLFKSATIFSVLNKKQYFDMKLLREITEITLKEK